MKEWEVWLKGDVPEGQGHSGVCDIIEHQLMGSATAETFEEAVAIVGAAYLEKASRYDWLL